MNDFKSNLLILEFVFLKYQINPFNIVFLSYFYYFIKKCMRIYFTDSDFQCQYFCPCHFFQRSSFFKLIPLINLSIFLFFLCLIVRLRSILIIKIINNVAINKYSKLIFLLFFHLSSFRASKWGTFVYSEKFRFQF